MEHLRHFSSTNASEIQDKWIRPEVSLQHVIDHGASM